MEPDALVLGVTILVCAFLYNAWKVLNEKVDAVGPGYHLAPLLGRIFLTIILGAFSLIGVILVLAQS